MRTTVVFLMLFLLLSCEDKKTVSKSPTPVEETSSKKAKDTVVTPSETSEERRYPVLNDKNAMEFFLTYEKEHKETKVRMHTDFGAIDILLFNNTKFHRANFIFLAEQNYFNDTQFYRIIDNFMIQGGNSDDKKTARKRKKIGKYLLPTDTKKGYKHDRGVISMPSSDIDNPHKLASPFEFFIVQQSPGAYYLDGDYTIFGRVTKGMDVVDKIASQKTDTSDWPLKNIYIKSVEILE